MLLSFFIGYIRMIMNYNLDGHLSSFSEHMFSTKHFLIRGMKLGDCD